MLQQIILTHVKAISFVHEISARKWVYYGYILEQYPNIYYKLCERLSLPDLCLTQMLLACDNIEEEDCGQTKLDEISGQHSSLIDYMIDNFGLDGQLKKLFDGIKYRKLTGKDFETHQNFDNAKLRVQLLCFLKFMIQLCICEVSFLKQIFNNKKDGPE